MVHQFLEKVASTEALSHRLARIRERFEYGKIGSRQDGQQGHAPADKQGREPKEGERERGAFPIPLPSSFSISLGPKTTTTPPCAGCRVTLPSPGQHGS